MPLTTTDQGGVSPHTGEMRRIEYADVRVIDPETGVPWTHYMDTRKVRRYLHGYGIDIALQTLVHKRAMNVGPRWWFNGQKPLTTKDEVDRYIREDLLRDQSPLAGRPRRRREKPHQTAAVKPRRRAK